MSLAGDGDPPARMGLGTSPVRDEDPSLVRDGDEDPSPARDGDVTREGWRCAGGLLCTAVV